MHGPLSALERGWTLRIEDYGSDMATASKSASQIAAILKRALAARACGDIKGATQEIARARKIDPHHPDVLHVAAIVANEAGQPDEALRIMRRSVARRPSDTKLHRSLGLIANNAGAQEEAIAALRISLAGQPADSEAARLLSAMLADGGAYDEALAVLHALPAAHRDLDWDYDAARLLALTHRHEEAVRHLSRVRLQRPKDVRLLVGLARSLAALERNDEAAAVFSDALSISASPADGAVLAKAYAKFKASIGDDDAADQFLAIAVMLEPDVPSHRGDVIKFALERPRFFPVTLWHAVRLAEITTDKKVLREVVPDLPLAPIYLDAVGTTAAAECTRMGRKMAEGASSLLPFPFANDPDPNRRLKIGYVSSDYRMHAVAKFSLGLIEEHDRKSCEVFGYAIGKVSDAVTDRFAHAFDHWVPVDVASAADRLETARRIRADGIDILVDLMGLTSAEAPALFMHRSAPVQITYLGFPGTTGLDCFDARLCDAVTDPPGLTDRFFVEPLLRLDRLFISYRPYGWMPEPAPEPPVCHTGFITFGCFNNPAKMTRPILALWARVLDAVPGSRLLVRNFHFDSDVAVAADIRRMFGESGIPSARLEILPRAASEDELMTSYRDVDIALDTFPYSGTTTTCDALWMGVPVVTRAGSPHSSRVSFAILRAIGLPELATESDSEFVAACVRLASAPDLLSATRRDLRSRAKASPLGNHTSLARSIERAYRELWRGWCARSGVVSPQVV